MARYPFGLRGDDIPPIPVTARRRRLRCVTRTRYRGARPPADALRELWRCAGTEFHADIVAALASALPGVTSDVTYGVPEQV